MLTTYLRNDILISEKKGGLRMYNEKKLQIIENIKNMPDKEADILEVFVAGFRAGKVCIMAELGIEQPCEFSMQTAQSQR